MRIARCLGAGPTCGYAEARRLVNQLLDAQIEEELQTFCRCVRGADLIEGVTAFMKKTKARLRRHSKRSDRRGLEERQNIGEKM
jgi:hypothetical protein